MTGSENNRKNGGDENGEARRAARGDLSHAFRAARNGAADKLDTLQKMFLAAATAENRTAAAAALNQFHQAAQRLRVSEGAFNRRARAEDGKLTLLKHLRSAEEFAAVRAFGAAKQALLGLSPDIGRRIVRLAGAAEIATQQATARPVMATARAASL
ncbi:MAG: hypothetical protein KGL10_01585 [Alphaproteobacteria bacterium]|nr:hypothetical protein [Alphaproteobacteria bacterium]MDE2335979.1 hypothetical protein [Alphaproteobacteria bacterium]